MNAEKELTIPQVVKKAMLQLIGPIIATTLVLVAVFVPVSMMRPARQFFDAASALPRSCVNEF